MPTAAPSVEDKAAAKFAQMKKDPRYDPKVNALFKNLDSLPPAPAPQKPAGDYDPAVGTYFKNLKMK